MTWCKFLINIYFSDKKDDKEVDEDKDKDTEKKAAEKTDVSLWNLILTSY